MADSYLSPILTLNHCENAYAFFWENDINSYKPSTETWKTWLKLLVHLFSTSQTNCSYNLNLSDLEYDMVRLFCFEMLFNQDQIHPPQKIQTSKYMCLWWHQIRDLLWISICTFVFFKFFLFCLFVSFLGGHVLNQILCSDVFTCFLYSCSNTLVICENT